eukprot:TRINITY_DN1085_c0_g1_i1.p1 TRINITY_DN1085_c0_g1~~TRINITY_DN1085_c0_g1_i1.p1  ORF type:complete len:1168 (+),score=412.75 TRINITY_DN1085_c0_g1_i1:73-3504(+)
MSEASKEDKPQGEEQPQEEQQADEKSHSSSSSSSSSKTPHPPLSRRFFTWCDETRLAVARTQADGFAKLGGLIARDPMPFVIVPWLAMFAFTWGLYNANIVVDPVDLWVQKGSRLEGEKDFYTTQFGDLTRVLGIQTRPKQNIDPQYADGNMMTSKHMAENYEIDGSILDMRPSKNPFWEMIGGCTGLSQTACSLTTNALCGWDSDTSSCIYQDKMGIMPSNQQKKAYTFNYLGVDWGWRELCVEVKAPTDPNNGVQTSMLYNVRAPCSKLMTPMDCFTEHPRSQQYGVLDLLNWNTNHPVSYTSQELYNKTLASPCAVWQGTYNSKGYTIGGATVDDNGYYSAVGSYKFLYPLNTNDDFADKYNNYIMKHPKSSIFYRQLGFPESITEEQAQDIIDGWESGVSDHLRTVNNQMYLSELTWITEWNVLDIIKSASVQNQVYVIIGLVLLLVIVWMFLFRVDFVSSRLLLGLYGVLAIAMAIAGTLGFAALADVDFNILTLQVLPYVGMGLGVDDMFVLLHYFEENCHVSVTHRMRMCYAHAGPSITATSAINAFVFFLGSAIPVKAVMDFAIQSGMNVIFNYFMVLFAFGGMLAVDARRVRNGGYDVVPCIVRDYPGQPKATHITKVATEIAMKPIVTTGRGQAIGLLMAFGVFGVGIYGAVDITLGLSVEEFIRDSSEPFHTYMQVRKNYYQTEINYVVGKNGQWNLRDNQIKLNRLVNQQLSDKVNAFGINGSLSYSEATFLPQGAAWSQVFRSYALQYPGAQDPNNSCECYPPTPYWYSPYYFRHFPIECTIKEDMYYDLLALFMGKKTCLEDGTVGAVNFKDSKYYPTCPGTAPHTIASITCQEVESSAGDSKYGDVFLPQGSTKLTYGYGIMSSYNDQVNFMTDENGEMTIEAWAIPVANRPIIETDVEQTLDMMKETRSLLDNSSLPLFAFGQSYLFAEQYRFVKENLRTLLTVAVCGSMVLTAFLMASATLAIIQTIVIGMSVTTLVGSVRMLGLDLNGVSMLSLTYGVGLNVELCVHICRAFLVARPTNPLARRSAQNAERIMFALSEMAIPVMDGAFTSFMSVIVLSFNKTPFFRKYFFYLYSIMILVSLFFAFVPLPILLCIFGPSPLPPNATHDVPEQDRSHEPIAEDEEEE